MCSQRNNTKIISIAHSNRSLSTIPRTEHLKQKPSSVTRFANFLQLCKNGEISSFIETIFQTIDPFNSDILILTEEYEAK